MRFISSRTHGIIDYLFGFCLIMAPYVLGFSDGGAETWVPVLLGLGIIIYSLFTDYELGMVRKIPLSVHLGLDVAGGVLLAISPWIFDFYELAWLPHVILGLLEIGVAAFTQPIPSYGVAPSGGRTSVR